MKKIIVLGVVLGLVLSINPVDFRNTQAQVAPLKVGGSIIISGAWPSSVNVRVSPCTLGCDVVGKVQDGAMGVITDGPRSGSGYTWWKVRFSSFGVFGLEGWVANNYLRSTTSAPGSDSDGQDTATPTPTGSFISPSGGEVWTQGQTKLISWQTPSSWDVSEVSLVLVDLNGNNVRSIGIIKDNVPASIQQGGDFLWPIPGTLTNGSYKIKATVNRRDAVIPSVILSSQFSIGAPSGGGDGGDGDTGGGDTVVGDVKTTTLFTGCSTNAPATPMPTINRAPTISYFSSPNESSIGAWIAGATDADSNNVFFYQFNWGDGTYSCFASNGVTGISGVTHTFTPGTYQVKLRVIDIYGAYNESVKSFTVSGTTPPPIVIQPPQPIAPVITDFSYKDAVMGSPNVPFRLVFNATDADSQLRSYSINWGDGSAVVPVAIDGTSITKEVVRTYPTAGRYLVDLVVTDATNLTATRRTVVLIGVPAACSTRFAVGDRVKVINGSPERGVNVRPAASASNTPLGVQANGSLGSVIGGPTLGSGLCWWQVNYDTAPDGWTAEFDGVVSLLEKVSSGPAVVNPPPVIDNPPVVDTGGQTGGFSSVVTTSGLAVGDSVRTLDYVRVRATPSLSGVLLGTQSISKFGKIIGGPNPGGGLIWWNIDYANDPDGWSAEKDEYGTTLLIKGSEPPPPPIIPDQPANGAPVLGQITQVTAPGLNTQGVWQVSATDPNGGTLNYAVDWGDGTSTNYSGNSGQVISIAHVYGQAGTRNITVSVSDGQATVTGTPFSVNIGSATPVQPPVLDPIVGPTQVSKGVNSTWQVRATGGSSALTYTVNWGDGSAAATYPNKPSGQSVPVAHSFATTGNKTITVTVSDGQLTSTPQTLGVSVIDGVVSNQSPSILSVTGNTSLIINTPGSWFVRASDPNGDSLAYTVTWGDGATNNYSGASGAEVKMDHTYTTISSNAGVYSFKVVVTDGKGGRDEENYIVNVSTNTDTGYYPPSRPVITGPTQIVAGTNGTWLVTFNDLDSTSLTYTIDWRDGTAPITGTVVSGQTLTFSHTYTNVNRYQSLLVTVSDGRTTETASPFINVTQPNQPPTIGSVSGPVDVKTAIARTWYITGTDPEGAVVNYTFNWGDGVISNYNGKSSGVSFGTSHIYQNSGTFTITVTVKDNGGLSATSGAYSVRVNKFAINDRVQVASDVTGGLAVRSTPNGTWIGGVNPLNKNGTKGTILEGPVTAGGYTWWKVAWDYTITGWSAENWLQQ